MARWDHTDRSKRRLSRPRDEAGRALPARERSWRAIPGGRYTERASQPRRLESVRVGDVARQERSRRIRRAYERHFVWMGIALALIVVLAVGFAVLYNSSAFTIARVEVSGVEHLTSEEMSQLAGVPAASTLLRVDTAQIERRLCQNAWVKSARVVRSFPSTLSIQVTERSIAAVVEVPVQGGKATKSWAVSDDHIWLMPIPKKGSEASRTTSSQIYADADAALHITDVPYGSEPEIGHAVSDGNVANALDIVAGMTTSLAGQVVSVSAAGPEETTLTLESGVQIAFGRAVDIRDKERVVLKILEENDGAVSYINVRTPAAPTWRAL